MRVKRKQRYKETMERGVGSEGKRVGSDGKRWKRRRERKKQGKE